MYQPLMQIAEVGTSASWSAIPLVAERRKNSGIAVLKK